MFEIREDYLSGYKVLMSDERAKRPLLWRPAGKYVEERAACPFCIENRHELSGIMEISEDGRLIVLPNKYPAVGVDGGFHEVIIDTNRHGEAFADFSIADMSRSLKVLFSRYGAMFSDSSIMCVQVFKNDGPGSGASIPHSHWQAVSIPFIPPKQAAIHNKFEAYYNENGKSYVESLAENKELIVYENDCAFAYMPYATPFGYNINVAPIRHAPSAEALNDDEIKGIAGAVKASVQALRCELGDFPYNICFQHAPKGAYPASHFYIELIPRTSSFGGLEVGSDVYINSYFPETAAAVIRKHIKQW